MMSTRKRESVKAASAGGISSSSRPPANRYRKLALWAVLLVMLPACIGAAVSWAVAARTPAHPPIVYGDGTHGPRGMAWVPGGEFLMGSDSKQAQPNERPAHKVRCAASSRPRARRRRVGG